MSFTRLGPTRSWNSAHLAKMVSQTGSGACHQDKPKVNKSPEPYRSSTHQTCPGMSQNNTLKLNHTPTCQNPYRSSNSCGTQEMAHWVLIRRCRYKEYRPSKQIRPCGHSQAVGFDRTPIVLRHPGNTQDNNLEMNIVLGRPWHQITSKSRLPD